MASGDALGHAGQNRRPGADADVGAGPGSLVRHAPAYRWLMLAVIALGALAFVLGPRILGRSVEVVAVERGALVQTVVTSGRVLPPAEISLSALVPGSVQSVSVREGDAVRKGQLLVQIDPAEASAAVAQARAALSRTLAQHHQVRSVTAKVARQVLEQARTRLDQAKLAYQREERLFSGDATTRTRLDDARTDLELARSRYAAAQAQAGASSPTGTESRSAAAAVAQARAELDAARVRLARTRVVAPVDGVVLGRSVEAGDVVQPGAGLLRLAATGRTQLVVEPDEKNLALLAAGQSAIASAEAFPARRFPARVVFIAPSVDARRGTIEVKLDVDKPPPYLRPAMTVSVEIEVDSRSNALSIDAGAVRDPGTDHPWVLIAKDGVARRATVKLGVRGDHRVEITDGVDAGTLVIPPGETAVEPGARVRPRLEGG